MLKKSMIRKQGDFHDFCTHSSSFPLSILIRPLYPPFYQRCPCEQCSSAPSLLLNPVAFADPHTLSFSSIGTVGQFCWRHFLHLATTLLDFFLWSVSFSEISFSLASMLDHLRDQTLNFFAFPSTLRCLIQPSSCLLNIIYVLIGNSQNILSAQNSQLTPGSLLNISTLLSNRYHKVSTFKTRLIFSPSLFLPQFFLHQLMSILSCCPGYELVSTP